MENNILELTQNGDYTVIAKTYDYNQNKSETEKSLVFKIEKKFFVKDVQGKILSENENTEVYDEFDNKMILPAGFMITEDADNVTQGLVVTDGTNEFVWIPVGDEIENESKTAKIELGRYADFTLQDNGQYLPVNENNNYGLINNLYKEEQSSSKGNIVARDLNNGFIKSVGQYGGYYIARYEARKENGNLVVKKDAIVYNKILQNEAANLSKNMYTTDKPFKSDLINSFAWDTAIIFIQTFGENKENYAAQKSHNNGALMEKGTDTDFPCNIYDMASNCNEWTTETCTSNTATFRGGVYNVAYSASSRVGNSATVPEWIPHISFRPILYIDPQN